MKLSVDLICKSSGLQRINDALLERSQLFCKLVTEANRKINLVSRAADSSVEITKQFLLSVSSLSMIPDKTPLRWLDIGSGGGFPALPLAIFRPQISFALVESVAKKAFFLERTAEILSLANVQVNCRRIEDHRPNGLTDSHRYDWVSVKAVADWEKTACWGDHFLKLGGCLMTYKPTAPSESEMNQAAKCNMELVSLLPVNDVIPDVNVKSIIMKKIA